MTRTVPLAAVGIFLATMACSLAVPSFATLTGSGNVITLEQDVTDFDSLEVGQAFHVTITQGTTPSIVIRIDDNLQPHLRVEQVGSKVSIGLDPDVVFNLRNTTLEADVTVPSLISLQLNGASRATLVDFVVDGDLALDASGASTLGGDLQAGTVHVVLSGASTASLQGGAQTLSLEAGGASTADLAGFPVADASIVVSGASNATVNASGMLDAEASGASHVSYVGDPTLRNVETSGASSIEAE